MTRWYSTITIVLLALGLLVVGVVLILRADASVRSATGQIVTISQRRQMVSDLYTETLGAFYYERGYILTGQEHPYYDNMKEHDEGARQKLAALQKEPVLVNSPNWKPIPPLVIDLLDVLNKTATLRQTGGFEAAQPHINQGQDKIDQIKYWSDKTSAELFNSIQYHKDRNSRSLRDLKIACISIISILVLYTIASTIVNAMFPSSDTYVVPIIREEARRRAAARLAGSQAINEEFQE